METNIDTRKIQQLGPSTLAITLPAEWAKAQDVKKGEDILLRHNENGPLTVVPKSKQQGTTEATIHAENLRPAAVERAIIGQYVLGRRIIRVKDAEGNLGSEYTNAVYNAETQLMGLGVIEEMPEQIAIRCSVDPEDFTLHNLLERLENTGRTMRNEAVKVLAHGNDDIARRAMNREKQSNKIFVLVLRLIFSAHRNPKVTTAVGLEDDFPLIGYRSIAKNLELTSDNAQRIAEIALEIDNQTLDIETATMRDLRDLNDQVNECMKKSVDAAVERDYDLAMEVRELFADITDAESDILDDVSQISNEQRLPLREVLVNLKQTAGFGLRNAEIVANLTLREDSEYVTIS